jgi:hypothetical protein
MPPKPMYDERFVNEHHLRKIIYRLTNNLVNKMSFMDKTEDFVLHSKFSDNLDKFNQNATNVIYAANDAMLSNGSNTIEVIKNLQPHLENFIQMPNAVIKEKFSDICNSIGEAMGNSIDNCSESVNQTDIIEAKMASNLTEEQSYER